MSYLDVFLRTLLMVIFGTAAIGKFAGRRAYHEFAGSVRAVGLGAASNGVAALTVVAELAVAVLLVPPATVAAGLLLGTVLLTAFALGVGVLVRRGRRVRCRCFGAGGAVLGHSHLARNLILLGVALLGLAVHPVAAGGRVGVLLLGGAAGAVCGLAVTRWDDLLYVAGVRSADRPGVG